MIIYLCIYFIYISSISVVGAFRDDTVEKPPKKLLMKPFKIVGANANDWMED